MCASTVALACASTCASVSHMYQKYVFICVWCRVLPNRKMENRFTAVGGYSESQIGASMVMESPDFALDAVHGPCERIDVPGAH